MSELLAAIEVNGEDVKLAPELAFNRPLRGHDPMDIERAMRLYPDREYPRFVYHPNSFAPRVERVLRLELWEDREDEFRVELTLKAVPSMLATPGRCLSVAVVGAEFMASTKSNPDAMRELVRHMLEHARRLQGLV